MTMVPAQKNGTVALLEKAGGKKLQPDQHGSFPY
jgi:hypothetical protein